MRELHDEFAEWVAAGAGDDLRRDVALHACGCDACLQLAAAFDALLAIDPGAAPPPPVRASAVVPMAPISARLGRAVAGVLAVIVVIGAGAVTGASLLGPRIPEAAVSAATATPGEGVLGAALSPAASPAPTTSEPPTERPSPSASPSPTPLRLTPRAASSPSPSFVGAPPPAPVATPTVAPTIAPTAIPQPPSPSPSPTAPVPSPSPSVSPSPSASPSAASPSPSVNQSVDPSPSPSVSPSEPSGVP